MKKREAIIITGLILFFLVLIILPFTLSAQTDFSTTCYNEKHSIINHEITCEIQNSLQSSLNHEVKIDLNLMNNKKVRNAEIYEFVEKTKEVSIYEKVCNPYDEDSINGTIHHENCTQIQTGTKTISYEELEKLNINSDSEKIKWSAGEVQFKTKEKRKFLIKWETNLEQINGGWGSSGNWKINPENWWNSSWGTKRAINITDKSGQNLANRTVEIIVNLIPNMNADFSDVRFVNASENAEYSYYYNETINATARRFYVRVSDNMTANANTTIYMYYRNPTATTTSNIQTAFVVADDFEDASLDTNQFYCAGCTEANGYIQISAINQNNLSSKVKFDGQVPYKLMVDLNTSLTTANYYGYAGVMNTSEQTTGARNYYILGTSDGALFRSDLGDTGWISTATLGYNPYNRHNATIYANQTSYNKTVQRGSSIYSDLRSGTTATGLQPIWIGVDTASNYPIINVFELKMSIYPMPEPLITFGAEEHYDTIPPTWKGNWTDATAQTKKGDVVHFNITLEDNVEGGSWIFSFFNSTTWQNNSEGWAGVNYTILNETRTITAIKDQEVKWRWYFSDSAGNKNETPIWSFRVANSPPNHTAPLLTTLSGKNFSYENLTCYNQSTLDVDGNNITNIYNWYKNFQPLAVLNMPFEINANDYSGKGNNGAIYGNPQFVNGKVGKALSFDGVDDYVDAGADSSLNIVDFFTLEAWINPKANGVMIISQRSDDTNWPYQLFLDGSNKLKLFSNPSGTNLFVTSSDSVNLNTWNHVVATRDGTAINFYINGIADSGNPQTLAKGVAEDSPKLTIGNQVVPALLSFFNGSIDEVKIYNSSLTKEQISANYNLEYNKVVSQETTAGDKYMCQVTPNDAESDGITKNSSTLNITWKIIFNVTSGEDNSQILNFNINCNNSFSASGVSSPYEAGFLPGSYGCTFSKLFFYNKITTFTSDNDKTVNVKLSREFSLTVEEHTWLEAIYNCVVLGDCNLYNMLLEINQTTGKIWEHIKPTDESVITFENITNKVVNSSNNLTIDYAINIPIKAGYSLGTYLPVRIGYWFLDVNNITCYNQGDKPTGVEDPYCQPLIIETIGPMGGQINFTVELQPSLPAGNYSIKRIVDIDPNNVWINYGQEVIGSFVMAETLSTYGISLENTGEVIPEKEGLLENIKSKITGAIVGVNQLISGWQIVAIIAIIGAVLIVFIISRTVSKFKENSIKKAIVNLFFLFFFIIILLNLVSATQTYLTQSSQWQQNLTKIYYSSTISGDVDNDGDLDLIATGSCGTNCFSSNVYINNGTGLVENQIWSSNLTDVAYGSLAFGDIDNDGDLDLALSGCNNGGTYVGGCNSGGVQTFIYINNGTSLVESSQWQSNLTKTFRGGLAFGDIDNDGDLDLTLSGQTETTYISKIYINNGTTLTESQQWQSNLTAMRQSGLAFGDIDNDDDLDLILSGRDLSSNKRIIIYINNGTIFNEDPTWQQNLETMDDSSVVLGDYDNDGDLDLSTTGCCDEHRIYRNNGTTFIEIQRELIDLGGIFAGSQAFGDYDNDGDLDLITNGREEHTFLYLYNSSSTNFTSYSQDPESHILDVIYGSLAWADLDNDKDLDLIETGYGSEGGGDGNATVKAFIYINNRSLTRNNTNPSPPNSSFSATYSDNILTLIWGNGSDVETNTLGLYYNLMVGNSTKNNTIVSGVYGGGEDNGYFGNMMQRKSINLNVQLEANKTYYWYVQTIDTGLMKSNWSAAQNFNTSLDVTKPNITINYPSPNASLHTSDAYFTFNATVTDANLTNVTLNANWTGSWHINRSNNSGINGTYTFTVNLTNYDDGHYAWYIGANDSSNNSGTSEIRDFYLDRAYPLVYLVSPVNSATWSSSSTVTFTYNVSDIDIANCSLIINNAIDQTNTTISENVNQTFTKSSANGNYNWNVNCTDYIGYTNSSETRSLTVSYTAPSSSSSGGGGTSITTKTYTATTEQITQGYTQQLANNNKIKFSINSINHSLAVNNVSLNYANLTLNSTAINFIIYVNETRKFNLTSSNFYDLLVKLNGINVTENKANLTIKQIYEKIKEEKEAESEKKAEKEQKKQEERKEGINPKFILSIIGIVVIIILVLYVYKKSGKR